MRPPRSALLNSCVRCSGSRLHEQRARPRARTARPRPCPPCRRAARRCGSPSSRRSSPSSAGRARRAGRAAPSAAARTDVRHRPSDGSRSKTQMSGWYRSGTREVHTCGVMRVLVGEPQQRSRVGDERMVHDAVLLRHLDALEPRRESPSRRPSARSPSCRCRRDSAPS